MIGSIVDQPVIGIDDPFFVAFFALVVNITLVIGVIRRQPFFQVHITVSADDTAFTDLGHIIVSVLPAFGPGFFLADIISRQMGIKVKIEGYIIFGIIVLILSDALRDDRRNRRTGRDCAAYKSVIGGNDT